MTDRARGYALLTAGLCGAAVLLEWMAPTPMGQFVAKVFLVAGSACVSSALSDPGYDETAEDEAKR